MARLLRIERIGVTTLCALALLVAACGGGDPTAVSTTAVATSALVDPVAIDPVDGTVRDDVVATLRAAIAELYATPVRVETELDEEGEPVVGDARIDREQGVADSIEIRMPDADTAITTRKVLVEGRAFLKSAAGREAEEALALTELSYEPFGPELLDEAFTAFGRIGPSLDRIVMLFDELPFAAQTTAFDAGEEISVILSPFAIAGFYDRTGLEAVGGRIEAEPTRISFRIENGVLAGIVADGVHFHDGEALHVTAAITYTQIAPFEVELPDVGG